MSFFPVKQKLDQDDIDRKFTYVLFLASVRHKIETNDLPLFKAKHFFYCHLKLLHLK